MPLPICIPIQSVTRHAFAILLGASLCLSTFAQDVPARFPPGTVIVSGTIEHVSVMDLSIKSNDDPSKLVTVKLAEPFHFYRRVPTDLAHVTDRVFVGVTSVKQPDGTERATEIHILPEEMRGVGEGSYMMKRSAGPTASRMTNGSVSSSPPSKAPVSASRMSNGSVKRVNNFTIAVQYEGGVQNVVVPPNIPVTETQLVSKKPAVGDRVFMLAKKQADGSLSTDNAMMAN